MASDVQLSPSWKAIIGTPGAKLGQRTLESFTHRPSEELYDLKLDPDEVVNLAANPSHAAVMAEMRNSLRIGAPPPTTHGCRDYRSLRARALNLGPGEEFLTLGKHAVN